MSQGGTIDFTGVASGPLSVSYFRKWRCDEGVDFHRELTRYFHRELTRLLCMERQLRRGQDFGFLPSLSA
jgi:hypothetical protein